MWPFKRKDQDDGATAVAERAVDPLEGASVEELRAEITRLADQNRARRDLETERRLLTVRHLLGRALIDGAATDVRHPEPATGLPDNGNDFPEIQAADLTPELLRAGILRDGALLVRGLIPREDALAFAAEIDRSFAEREEQLAGRDADPAFYDEFTAGGRFDANIGSRPWIREGGGVLAGDSPMLSERMFELLRANGVPPIVDAYLGEPAIVSFEKTTLRKATPNVPGAWHQDGAFMGPVRALNLWLSLSRCGDEAPGLDVVPRRLDDYVTAGGEGTFVSYQVTNDAALAVAEPKSVVRPIFEPGDALLFDEKCLHQTASDPSMPNPRYALESWFFGGSAFPEYIPIAV